MATQAARTVNERIGRGGVRDIWLAVTIVVVAALLRLPGLSSELWLDEIRSIQNAFSISQWWEIFTRLREDNTHHLNSLWLFVAGPGQPAWLYRLPSFAGSLVAVIAAWRIGAREDRVTGLMSAAVVGGSFLLIYYASEARGYGMLSGAVLAAWWFLQRFADSRSWRDAAGFWIASTLALLSHATAIGFLFGAYVWADAKLTRRNLKGGTRDTLRAFAVPGALAAVFYVGVVRGQQVLGGPSWALGDVMATTLSAAGSGPLSGPGMVVCAAVMGLLVVFALADAWRRGDDRWIFYVVTGVLLPAVLVALTRPPILFPRYFTVQAVVLLLPVASYLARRPPGVAASIVSLYCAGALVNVVALSGGRSHYNEAIGMITSSGLSRVGTYPEGYTGHEWRTSVLLSEYGNSAIALVKPPEIADWLIVEGTAGVPVPPGYRLRGTFDVHPFTAPSWTLYSRAP